MRRPALSAIAAVVAALPLGATADDGARTLRVGMPGDVHSTLYYHESKAGAALLTEAVFDTLIAYDARRARFAPLIATAWQRIDDRTLDFELRSDVKWHDGVALNADDVLYTLNWLSDPQTRLHMQHKWGWIDHAEKLGRHKVRLVSKRPTPFDVARVATVIAILPEHRHGMLLDDRHMFGRDPVGSGPYRGIARAETGIVLERVPRYVHGGAAKPPATIARVVVQSRRDSNELVADFRAGALDAVLDAPPTAVTDVRSLSNAKLTAVAGYGMLVLSLDARGQSLEALRDPRVRLALDTAIDRSQMVARAPGARLPDRLCWRSQAGCGAAPPAAHYDPAGARRLLAVAGHSDLALTVVAQGDAATAAAEIVARQWRTVGVAARVESVTPQQFYVRQRDGKLAAAVIGWHGGEMPDVAETVATFLGDGIWDRHGDAALHALAATSAATMQAAPRSDAMRLALARADDHAYFTVLGPLPNYVLHRSNVAINAHGRYGEFGLSLLDFRWR